mmetsp:Transcript_8105/g.23954  ORF Transcript_8105/g.23954 Transcript_8105/m.23954 type:complete len:99 (-) Transcript_8105:85-381(-)
MSSHSSTTVANAEEAATATHALRIEGRGERRTDPMEQHRREVGSNLASVHGSTVVKRQPLRLRLSPKEVTYPRSSKVDDDGKNLSTNNFVSRRKSVWL